MITVTKKTVPDIHLGPTNLEMVSTNICPDDWEAFMVRCEQTIFFSERWNQVLSTGYGSQVIYYLNLTFYGTTSLDFIVKSTTDHNCLALVEFFMIRQG